MQILFSCSPVIKNGHEYSHWINKVFSDCIWSVKDYFSFFIGLSSILCWLVAQLPQIILNYKTKRADSLSFIFLTEWLLGDITNLTGCILAHQLPPQTATAIYFVIIDLTLFVEFVWYRNKNKKTDQEKLKEKQPLLHSESISDLEGDNSSINTDHNINQNESDETLSLSGSGSGSGSGMSINAIMGIIGFGSITYLGIFTLTKAFTPTTNFNIDNRNLLSKGPHEVKFSAFTMTILFFKKLI
ncbi:lysosomal amino acid transporter 1 [Anaeramoeba flamelloides]|uniref:Lysosomal amino acid transporter 1 n=1 Tax=Anaeramoeba flamelloides TaxID=1746091 RepID=A0ABQ8X268_9EUKA|nr:lysosomal amino acid transporter 1 [Anaeramoeba flamelloides]